MRHIVISDIHGEHKALMNVLTRSGAVRDDEKQDGHHITFVGDIVDLGRYADIRDDIKVAKIATRYGDDFVVGNHEFPFLFPPLQRGMEFSGMISYIEATDALNALPSGPRFMLATNIGPTLVTHAGLHPSFELRGSATQIADDIGDVMMKSLRERILDPIIGAIGRRRGGYDALGGILWSDARDLKVSDTSTLPPQIVGHTPMESHPEKVENVWYIDPGKGRVVALISDDSGESWEPIISD